MAFEAGAPKMAILRGKILSQPAKGLIISLWRAVLNEVVRIEGGGSQYGTVSIAESLGSSKAGILPIRQAQNKREKGSI